MLQFIGYWYCHLPGTFSAYGYVINIDNNSNGTYQMFQGTQVINTIQGTARASNKKLKIGWIHSFDISRTSAKIRYSIFYYFCSYRCPVLSQIP